eukprot:gb/GECG01007001.1/.p1 GENE.gb/GECG01007001.1/~~gb/GECG01007001.1/.p1  ORF type:complete len:183 (+),score=24.07 gb/GECG01007001.1/:1-549(+)
MDTKQGQAFDVSYRWARLMPFPRDPPKVVAPTKDPSSSLWIPLALGLGALGLASLYTIAKGSEDESPEQTKEEPLHTEEHRTGQEQDERHTSGVDKVDTYREDDANSESSRDSPAPPPETSSSSTEYARSEQWTHRRLPTTYEGDQATGIHRKTESRQTQVVEERIRHRREYRKGSPPDEEK